MAYLNVRDRRIEATIAYVGPELAGKKTNFERLGTRERDGGTVTFQDDGLTLEWRPSQRDRFDDCDLRVKLVAPESGLDEARLDDVLAGADGIVVVVEATAESRSETLRALHLVREALERSDATPPRPVVVQLNKADLADPAVADEVAQTTTWPVVRASAMRGEGVMETLESALDNVVRAMKRAPTAGTTSSPIDRTPLLGALRDVLRETVSEQVATLERAIIDRTLDAISNRFDALSQVLAARHDRTIEAFTSTSKRIEALERGLIDVRSTLRESGKRTAELGVEIGRQTSAISDLSAKHAAVAAEVSNLRAKTEALSGAVDETAAAVPTLAPRIAAVESSVQREIRTHLERLSNAVTSAQTDAGDTFRRTEKRADEIKGHLDELLDELKRRKKGWFG